MDLRLRGDDEKGWVLQIFPTWLRMQVKTVSARLSNTLSRHLRAGGDPCVAACAASTRELQGARGLIGFACLHRHSNPHPRHLRAGGDPCFAACAASTRKLQGARGLMRSRT